MRESPNGSILGSFTGTDSVRSATIRRGGNGGRPRSSIQVFEQGPLPGVPAPEVIPIAMPTPPTSRTKSDVTNGNVSDRSSKSEESKENVRYKPPLVKQVSKQLSNKLTSGQGSFKKNHRFQYNATDDFAKKG